MKPNPNFIEILSVEKTFKDGTGEFSALNNINLTFRPGEFSGLVGPSGSGKTTLLNIIGTLDIPTNGQAMVIGKDTSRLSHKESALFRNRHIGFIFQSYNLLPVYTVFENVEFALLLQNVTASECKKRVMEALARVGIEHLRDKKPNKLSGGEGQRVAIARAMVKRPQIIIADEPTANLDSVNAHKMLQIMKTLNQELNTTFLFSTHDEKVMQYLTRIIYLNDGQVEKDETIPAKQPPLSPKT